MKVQVSKIVIIGIVLLFAGCKEDPFKELESNDRQFLAFKVPGQIGPARIRSGEDNTGRIEVFVIEGENDFTNIVPEFVVSVGADVTPIRGEAVNLIGDSNQKYTVVSESGLAREWEIIVSPFQSTLQGNWEVLSNVTYDWQIGLNEVWGWGVFGDYDPKSGSYDPAQYAPENLLIDMPDASLENDNTLSFETVLINENGNPEGTFVFDAGLDGQFAPFIINPNRFGGSTNYAYRFRRIPQGSGVWEFNETGKVLTLWRGNKSGSQFEGTVTENADGSIRISFDVWINEFTWDHWEAESHLLNAITLYYDFKPID